MGAVFWVLVVIQLYLVHTSNAKPRLLTKNNKNYVHYTNIGDITAKDLLRIADESTPADKRFISPDETEDGNDIEAERNRYYMSSNNNLDLASPPDQEQKFVNLLKKQYKGTFPEYGKETETDYSKNKDLEDNLSVQPETVFLGHTDMYHGKNGNNEDSSDYQVPDDVPTVDNLATFDSDANLLNAESEDTQGIESFHGKTNSPTKSPAHTTARHHTSPATEDNEIQNDSTHENNNFNNNYFSDDDEAASGTNSIEDKPLRTNKEQDEASGTSDVNDIPMGTSEEHDEGSGTSGVNDGPLENEQQEEASGTTGVHNKPSGIDEDTEELKKLKEKTEEEALWDANEKLRQQLLENKKKETKFEQQNNKEKSKKKNSSGGIIEEFEELKGHNKNTPGEHNGIRGDNKKLAGNRKVVLKVPKDENVKSGNKDGKKIKYIQTEESQVAGDAILDFLDKLLEKDPEKLRHDVLTMAKEMQHEGNVIPNVEKATSTANEKLKSTGQSGNTVKKPQRKITTGFLKNTDKDREVDKWISELENKIDKEKEAEVDDPNGIDDNYENEEYNQFHDQSQDIYPDHNDGEMTTEAEPENDGFETGRKSKDEENNDKIKKQKEKNQEEFDYEEFKEEALKMHNEYRRRHNAVALQWSEKLAKKAHDVAVQLLDATRNSFKRELEKHGESIAILPHLTKNIAKTAVEKWYSEITKFSFAKPGIKPETRDFTQIIWKGSKQVGMGFADTTDKKKTLVVALYSPAGNNEQEIRMNLNTVNDDPYADIRKATIGRQN